MHLLQSDRVTLFDHCLTSFMDSEQQKAEVENRLHREREQVNSVNLKMHPFLNLHDSSYRFPVKLHPIHALPTRFVSTAGFLMLACGPDTSFGGQAAGDAEPHRPVAGSNLECVGV